jgi:hypothetical protein
VQAAISDVAPPSIQGTAPRSDGAAMIARVGYIDKCLRGTGKDRVVDDHSFDALTRRLAGPRSRRSVVRSLGLAAGAALGVLGRTATGLAATCRPKDAICRKAGDCCSGYCGPKDATGRQRCGCGTPSVCGAQTSCDASGDPCCACATTAEGQTSCVAACELSEFQSCAASADCPAGWPCTLHTCFGSICLPPCSIGNATDASVSAATVGVNPYHQP